MSPLQVRIATLTLITILVVACGSGRTDTPLATAEQAFFDKDWRIAGRHFQLALSGDLAPRQAHAVRLKLIHCWVQSNDRDSAMDEFDMLRAESRDDVSGRDFQAIAADLLDAGFDAEATDVLNEGKNAFPELAGDFDRSLAAMARNPNERSKEAIDRLRKLGYVDSD